MTFDLFEYSFEPNFPVFEENQIWDEFVKIPGNSAYSLNVRVEISDLRNVNFEDRPLSKIGHF